MRITGEHLVPSPSDITAATECEFAWLRGLDVILRRGAAQAPPPDAMQQRTAALGATHEAHILDGFRAHFGDYDPTTGTGVYRIAATRTGGATIEAAAAETAQLLRARADVIYQGAICTPRLIGYPDFLVRDASGAWEIHDAKLARHATVPALIQIAAYADELAQLGVPVARYGYLELGSGERPRHDLGEIIPVYRERRARLEAIAAEHRAETGVTDWGAARYAACGRCAVCAAEIETHRDVLLVANMRMTQRSALLAAGIDTIDALAANTAPVPGVPERVRQPLTAQARLQVQQSPPGAGTGAGSAVPAAPPTVRYDVFDPGALAVLPAPDPGDIFFDFEGDPLWSGPDPAVSGLEYLFGVVEAPIGAGTGGLPVFRPFWAHDRTQERQALIDFLAYVAQRRAAHPRMHIYHYAAYEKSALLRLAGRYGVGEEQVDDLLRDGVLVDLYAVVRNAVRISQPSYSIKMLEPLYIGDELRSGVTNAADSVVAYAEYCALRDAGRTRAARARLDEIADYNRYDCVSTLRLRDWLAARAADRGVALAAGEPPHGGDTASDDDDPGAGRRAGSLGTGPGADTPTTDPRAGRAATDPHAGGAATDPHAGAPEETGPENDDPDGALVAALTDPCAGVPWAERTAEQQARALLAASLGYHRREDKPFWWAHFDRLAHPIDEWADTTGVLVVDSAAVVEDWAQTGRQQTPHRRLRLTGTIDGGKPLDDQVQLLYEPGAMPTGVLGEPGRRGTTKGTVTWRDPDDAGTVEIDERAPAMPDGSAAPARGPALPVALAPGSPVPTGGLHDALVEVAQQVVDGSGARSAVMRLLERGSPLSDARAAPDPDPAALADVLAGLDESYLAVQGPPGSGKTYTGARVVRALVRRGWRIGVVAQSHRVVENFLDAVGRSGVAADRIGKKRSGHDAAPPPSHWTALPDKKIHPWCTERAGDGYVLGGTAWDFVNTKRVDRGGLDLLVIDEAGQFSLANTVAVSVAAPRLLLLGDPQQLPQVSQGTHPEPCDGSALSWVMGEHHVIAPSHGVFLAQSWRMHPELCAAVSRLSYDGELTARRGVTDARALDGVAPGIRTVEVGHDGNATSSVAEAAEVVRQAQQLIGRSWQAPDDAAQPGPRPLTENDILVVAPYNAQVAAIRRALTAAGLDGVRVGTVDKFQGQQAPVVIVSMTASAPSDVPRGMAFLLSRNRITVAVSRAQWCSIIVRSPRLTDYLPGNPVELAELGAFIRLCAGQAPQHGRVRRRATAERSPACRPRHR